jgi:hypothetical protein
MKKSVHLLTKCLKSLYLTAHIGDEAMQVNFKALTSSKQELKKKLTLASWRFSSKKFKVLKDKF